MSSSTKVFTNKHNWKIILLFLIAASTLAVKVNYFSSKTFQSVALIKTNEKIFENHPGKLENLKKLFSSKASVQDGNLRQAVMEGIKNKKFNVAYFYTQPLYRRELFNSSPITVSYIIKNENFYKQKFDFKYLGENKFALSYEMNGIARKRIYEFGKEIHEMAFNFTIIKNPKIYPSKAEILLAKNMQFTISSDEAMADNLLKYSINISSLENGFANISVTTSVPEKSMLLANCISESFIKSSNKSNSLNLINQQLANVSAELEKARGQFDERKSEDSIGKKVKSPAKYQMPFENIEEKKQNLELLSNALENLSDSLRKNRNNLNATIDYGLISDPLITQFIDTLNEKIKERKDNLTTDTSILDMEITTLHNTIASVVRNTRKKVALEQDKIKTTYPIINSDIVVAQSKMTNVDVLNQKLFLTEKLYNFIADKKTEADALLPLEEGTIVQKASLPHAAENANAGIVWLLAITLGMLTGSMAVILIKKFMALILSDHGTTSGKGILSWFANIEMQDDINSAFQFQNLCTKMLLLAEAGEKQIITITSEGKGDGKTFIAAQLAKSLVALDLNVLIIDLDLINPSIGEQFEIQTTYTLADVLHKQAGIHEAVQITSIPNLDILTAGQLPFGINSLISTNRMGKILSELKEHYDFIIIDTADTTNSIDAVPCMKLSNSTLYITRQGSDEQFVFDKVSKIKTSYNIENIFFISGNFKRAKNSGQIKSTLKNLEEKKKIVITKTPLLKRVALWFY